ncbi:MAG: FHA domain-containing protein [Planctomycetota bacterium]
MTRSRLLECEARQTVFTETLGPPRGSHQADGGETSMHVGWSFFELYARILVTDACLFASVSSGTILFHGGFLEVTAKKETETIGEHRDRQPPGGNRLAIAVVRGPRQGTVIFAEPETVVRVGRSADVELVVPDPALSRVHFELRWSESGWNLKDLNSHNGTFLRGRRIDHCSVLDQDSIRAGDTLFRVTLRA